MKLFWEWHRYSQRSNIFSYIYNNSKVLDYIYYIIVFFENETLYANKYKYKKIHYRFLLKCERYSGTSRGI